MTSPLFEECDRYEAMLEEGIRLSGEGKDFFLRGRVLALCGALPPGAAPRRILDFGCGTGETAAFLAERFPRSEVVGVDASPKIVEHCRRTHRGPRTSFEPLASLPGLLPFDLAYVNGVFHHVPVGEREATVRRLRSCLADGAHLGLFDNNPYNPGARLVMRRIPFDRDAVMLSAATARRLLVAGGFRTIVGTRHLFVFPRALSPLRRLEPFVARLPLGAQYLVLARA